MPGVTASTPAAWSSGNQGSGASNRGRPATQRVRPLPGFKKTEKRNQCPDMPGDTVNTPATGFSGIKG